MKDKIFPTETQYLQQIGTPKQHLLLSPGHLNAAHICYVQELPSSSSRQLAVDPSGHQHTLLHSVQSPCYIDSPALQNSVKI